MSALLGLRTLPCAKTPMQGCHQISYLRFQLQVNFNDPWSWVKMRVISKELFTYASQRIWVPLFCMSLVYGDFTSWQIVKPTPSTEGLDYLGLGFSGLPPTPSSPTFQAENSAGSYLKASLLIHYPSSKNNNEVFWFNGPPARLQQTQKCKSKSKMAHCVNGGLYHILQLVI